MKSEREYQAEFHRRMVQKRKYDIAFGIVVLVPLVYTFNNKLKLEDLPLWVYLMWGIAIFVAGRAQDKFLRCPACEEKFPGKYRRSSYRMRTCPGCGILLQPEGDRNLSNFFSKTKQETQEEPNYLRAPLIGIGIFSVFIYFSTGNMKEDSSDLYWSLGFMSVAMIVIFYFVGKKQHASKCKKCGALEQFNDHCDQCGEKMHSFS